MSIPCWIISLDPSAPMPSSLAAQLAAQGVDHRFIPGVDGRRGKPPLVGREHIAARRALIRHGKTLTSSELGCYLAHYRAVQRAWDEGLERICIMEDDVSLEDDFARVLAAVAALPEDMEMVRLMALRVRRRKVLSPLPGCDSHRLVRPERGWCGCQAYVVNRRGMKKFLDYACAIFEPVDKVIDHFWEFDLRLYGVEPHVCWENEHPTSIVKVPAQLPPVPLHYRLAAPFAKLAFSISRHSYLRRHADEFYPAEKPPVRMGRTKRMR